MESRKPLYREVPESELDSIVEDALAGSDAPKNWPEASDCDVCSLSEDELRAVIADTRDVAQEDGVDPRAAAVNAIRDLINRDRLWE